jgi:hypothetical protein
MITAATRFGDYVDAAFAAQACQPAMDVAVTIDPELTSEQGVQAMIAHPEFDERWAVWSITYGPDIDETLKTLWKTVISSQLAIDEALAQPNLASEDRAELEAKVDVGTLLSEIMSDDSIPDTIQFQYLERLEGQLPSQALDALRTRIESRMPHLFNPEDPSKITFPGAKWDYDENGEFVIINPEDRDVRPPVVIDVTDT